MTIARLFVPGQTAQVFAASQVPTLATFFKTVDGKPDYDRPVLGDLPQAAALMGLPQEQVDLLYSDSAELVYGKSNAADYDDAQPNTEASAALSGLGGALSELVGPILIVSED